MLSKKQTYFYKKKRRNIHQSDRRQTKKKHIENYKRNPILEHKGGEREEDFFTDKEIYKFWLLLNQGFVVIMFDVIYGSILISHMFFLLHFLSPKCI